MKKRENFIPLSNLYSINICISLELADTLLGMTKTKNKKNQTIKQQN